MKPKLTASVYKEGTKWKVKLNWTAVPGVTNYSIFGNADGWANLPTYKDLATDWINNVVVMDLEVDRLNEFWIRANPSASFRCINKTTLSVKE